MADYNYKGYTAQVFEDVVEWGNPPAMSLFLFSEFGNMKMIKHMTKEESLEMRWKMIRRFEKLVDKHLQQFK